jgi:iron-sulfur cluster assembly protein
MITLSSKAKEMIETLSNEMGIGHYSLRVKMLAGGCAGMTQDIDFNDFIGALDEVIEFDGIKLIIDPFSRDLLGDFTLDFIDTPMNSGFKFLTSKITHTSCGCGSSIGLV